MAKFCPEWVFSSSVAAVAGGFLHGNAPITVFANQFSNELKKSVLLPAAGTYKEDDVCKNAP